MADFDDFFSLIAEGKKDYKENDPMGKRLEKVKENIKTDFTDFFTQLSQISIAPQEPLVEEDEVIFDIEEELEIREEVILAEIPAKVVEDSIVTYTEAMNNSIFKQAEVPIVDPTLKAVQDKLKYLEQWVGKISVAGPGGGEVNLRYLDDVARETISDGRWLKYDGISKKFVFDEINPYEVVYNVTEVTTSEYTIQDGDYYIGVDYAGPTTIILPASANSGRVLVIKDEDGDAATNPITVTGTVDNDAGGFILQLNNGGIQLIYRNGSWRII